MTFLQAIQSGFQKIFDFHGRTSRTEFWYWCLFWFLCAFFLYICAIVFFVFSPYNKYHLVSLLNVLFWGGLLLEYVVIIPIAFRRLHDINQPGWYCILWYTICTLSLIALSIITDDFSHILSILPSPSGLSLLMIIGLGLLGPIVWLLVWFCKKGDVGDNRYGPDPLVKTE